MIDPRNLPNRIQAQRVKLQVCENGHVVSVEKADITDTLVLHSCGRYTAEDGNYCAHCGVKLNKAKRTKDD